MKCKIFSTVLLDLVLRFKITANNFLLQFQLNALKQTLEALNLINRHKFSSNRLRLVYNIKNK